MKNKVLLIIVSYNGQKYWPDLLPTLNKEVYTDFDLEILVVDNASTDSSVEHIKNNFPNFKLIKLDKNEGFVGANNTGYYYAKEIKAKYIYLLNQDTVITPGFLQPLYEYAEKNKFGTLQSKINLWPDKDKINTLGNQIHFLGFGYGMKSGQLDMVHYDIRKINYSSGAGVFINMEALEKLGYLFDDTLFLYLEDLDLGWSLQLLGYDNYLIPSSQIYHKYEFNRSMQAVYWFERNRLWVLLKNYHVFSILLLWPAWLLMEIGQIYFAYKNNYLLKKIKAYSFLYSYPQWQKLLYYRRLIQKNRQRTDRQVVQNFSGKILFQALNSPALGMANFFFNIYWRLIRLLIVW
jgi:GT2 family glycosyltransferase